MSLESDKLRKRARVRKHQERVRRMNRRRGEKLAQAILEAGNLPSVTDSHSILRIPREMVFSMNNGKGWFDL